MTATVAGFRELFPEFAANTDEQVQAQMNLALAVVNECAWAPELYDYAVYYLTAHYLWLYNLRVADPDAWQKLTTGSAIMKKVGDVQVQKSEQLLLKAIDNPYLLTPYGIWYYENLAPAIGAWVV
jgi:hypothetical protein